MCIAISKPIGVGLPSDEILKNCWENNDDGAGFAFNFDGRVFIKKGFMTFKDFMKALKTYDARYNFKECGVLMHFRIATHGARDASMTHPFPIVDDAGCLKKIEYVSDYAVIHNGIITLTSTTASRSAGLSDTALFIKDYLTKIAGNKAWLRKQCNMELIEKLIDSKMAILDKYGNIKMTSGFTEDNGVFYSNSSYKDSYYRTYTYYSGGSYSTKTKKNTKGSNYRYDDYDYDYGYGYGYGSGYGYDYDSYDDYIADKVDNSKSVAAKYQSGLKGLMKLKSGYFVECGEYSDQVESDGFEYYVDSKNNLYLSCDNDKEDEDIDSHRKYTYMGNCVVYDRNLKEVPFTRDVWAYAYQFDEFEDEDVFDEVESVKVN